MLIPRKLHLQKWATWDNVDVPLDTSGITYIRGRNNDDNVKNSNASGKSSLLNSIYALLFGQHQLAARKNSLGKIVDDSTVIDLIQNIDDHKIRAKLAHSKLRVSIDGKAVVAHKKSDERVELLSYINIPIEMWSSTVHVNGIAGNPLLRGTSATRCQFLEHAFNLDRWTPLSVKVGDILAQMKRTDEELERLKTEYNTLQLLDKDQFAALKEKQNMYQQKLLKLQRFVANVNRVLGILSSLPKKPDENIEQLQNKILKLEKMQKLYLQHHLENIQYNKNCKEKKKYKLQLQKLQRQLSFLGKIIVEDNLERKLVKLEQELVKYKEQEGEIYFVKQWEKLAKLVAASHKISYDSLEQLHILSQSWVKNWKTGQVLCPVCGSKLKAKVDGKQLQQLQELLPKFDQPFETNNFPNLDILRKRIAILETKKATKNKQEKLQRQFEEARRNYQRINILERPRNIIFEKDKLQQLQEDFQAAKQWERAAKYSHLDSKRLQSKLLHTEQLQETLTSKLANCKSTLLKVEEDFIKAKKLQKKITILKGEIELRSIYKALKSAYSPNGMRLWLLTELLETLISGLNNNSYSTRDHKTYGYRLSRSRDLSLTASNSRGTFDLFMLSGAESSLFTLNLLTVLLPMLPASSRCNMLILDEIDSNCSSYVKGLIADVYLPQLAEIVGSLFVLTPSTQREFYTVEANEWLVVKQNGISKLEM
jgi:DNA repair exonuclease SbcCD ATPase subunit